MGDEVAGPGVAVLPSLTDGGAWRGCQHPRGPYRPLAQEARSTDHRHEAFSQRTVGLYPCPR